MTDKPIKCGQMVTTKMSKYSGMVTAKLVRFRDTQFEITFVQDNEHKVIWLHRQEFDLHQEKKIGFKNQT